LPYCVNADVIAEFKSLDTASTGALMTTTKIDGLIAQSDAYINGRICQVYVTPITGAESLLIMKKISIGLTAERIANILRINSKSKDQEQLNNKDLIKEAKEDLKFIANKELSLQDATLLSSTGSVNSYTLSNEVTRAFNQGTRQW